jgi:hypothetical protein
MIGWIIAWLYVWGFVLQMALVGETYRKEAKKPTGIDVFLALFWPIFAPVACAVMVWVNRRK